MDWLETGAKRAGRSVDDIDVATYVLAAVDDDPAVARVAVAEHIAYYLRDVPGYYGRVAREAGLEAEVATVRNATTTAAGATRLSDEFLDVVSVWGTPDEARAGLEALREAGVDLPIVRAPTGVEAGAVRRVLETFAPDRALRTGAT